MLVKVQYPRLSGFYTSFWAAVVPQMLMEPTREMGLQTKKFKKSEG